MARGWGLIIAVMGLVLLAGCSGVLSGESDTPVPTDTITDSSTESTTPTATRTPTPTATPEPVDPDNPYRKEALIVGFNDSSSRDVNRTTEITSALEFWEEHASEYAGYPVNFTFQPTATSPDIEIELVDDIQDCGLTIDPANVTVGCSPVPTSSVDTPVTVRVVNEFAPSPTEEVLRHELGHALGLDHEDEPRAVMEQGTVVYPSSLEYTYTVEDNTGYHHPGAINRQLSGAEEFLETGGGGTIPPDVTIKEVDDRSKADLVVLLEDEDACKSGVVCTSGSWDCLENGDCRGEDSGVTLTLSQIKTEAVGWMVARELFIAILEERGATGIPSELNAEETDPTKSWWM